MRASKYSTQMVHPRRPRRQPDALGVTSEREHPMLVAILGVLVIAHGLVTTAIWVLPAGKDAPFDASHSWLLGDVRAVSVALGVLVGLAFVATGVGVLGHFGWWPGSAVMGLAISVTVLIAGIRALTSS